MLTGGTGLLSVNAVAGGNVLTRVCLLSKLYSDLNYTGEDLNVNITILNFLIRSVLLTFQFGSPFC